MIELRELGGGAAKLRDPNPQPVGIKLVEEILVDILKILEDNTGRQKAFAA